MGYKIRSATVVLLMSGMVFTLLFLIDMFYLGQGVWFVSIASLFWLFIQYLISPVIIGFIYRINWYTEEELANRYPHLHAIILQSVNDRQLKRFPRFGIINDGNPNAFTYGWSKNSARLVITSGILDLLDENEQKAVVGHELGHIVHQDFIVMTFINAIPILFYTIYRVLLNVKTRSRSSRSRSRDSNDMTQYLVYLKYILVIISYLMYIIGTFVALLLSRWREYWADEYSAELNQNPDALSTALVKIAYGILQDPSETKQRQSRSQYVRALGIFDKRSAKALAFSSTNAAQEMDMNIFAKAAAWDLYQPWAKYFEIFSTHPLPAKRIRALNTLNEDKFHKQSSIDLRPARFEFKKQMGSTALDEFIGELFIQILPNLVFWTWILVGVGFLVFQIDFTQFALFPVNNIWSFFVLGFVLMGLFVLFRNSFKYRMKFRENSIINLIGTINVSPIRPVPTITKGTVIGRGVPGLFWSEDLVIRDQHGLIYIDYDYGINLINTLFGIFRAQKLKDKNLEIIGWYRRGPTPYIQVHRIRLLDGSEKVIRNHKRGIANFGGILLIALGIILWIGLNQVQI